MTKHGHTRKNWQSPTYRSWNQMWMRVQHHARYKDIHICPRWQSFENFLADMGVRPEGKTLDRKDNGKLYSPSTCRWATPKQQARNRRNNRWFTFGGKRMLLQDWAKKLNVNKTTLERRLRRMTFEQCVTHRKWTHSKLVELI